MAVQRMQCGKSLSQAHNIWRITFNTEESQGVQWNCETSTPSFQEQEEVADDSKTSLLTQAFCNGSNNWFRQLVGCWSRFSACQALVAARLVGEPSEEPWFNNFVVHVCPKSWKKHEKTFQNSHLEETLRSLRACGFACSRTRRLRRSFEDPLACWQVRQGENSLADAAWLAILKDLSSSLFGNQIQVGLGHLLRLTTAQFEKPST